MESHHLQGLYAGGLTDASMAALHHHQAAGHPGMHHLLATGQLKMDPHFSHHPFSINSIIAATSDAASKDMKLYDMGYASSYAPSISPMGPGPEPSTASYYHHHPSAVYHTTSI